MLQTKAEIEACTARAGLKIMHALLEGDIDPRCGAHGQPVAYRHGTPPGYVVFAGRKVSIPKPRLRQKGGPELTLPSYAALPQAGRLQRAVARPLTHQVSTRNYARAIDDCLAGYGIHKSSVSRQWKEATAGELQKLCQRPVPADLATLFLDGPPFWRECFIVALGGDRAGEKHVLGLWHGATENATVVRALLADLPERGLHPEASILVVIDGAKALYKGVKDIFGERAFIQRCRVHPLRNVVEHLPRAKRAQAVWRLRGAWAKATPEAALKELRAVVKWLEGIRPSGARRLEEGLEETLTVTRLGLDARLVRSRHSANLIESCFARTAAWTSRVKHWRNAKRVMRWGAAALLFAEQGFRRIQGHEQLGRLLQALQENDARLAPQKKTA